MCISSSFPRCGAGPFAGLLKLPSEAPRVALLDFLGGKQQCVRGADCTPQTHCNLQPVSLVREGMMISYRVPKVKPLKVLGRGKGEVMEFKNSHSATLCYCLREVMVSIPQHCFLLAASGTTQPRGTGSVAGQFINDCLGTHINISQM